MLRKLMPFCILIILTLSASIRFLTTLPTQIQSKIDGVVIVKIEDIPEQKKDKQSIKAVLQTSIKNLKKGESILLQTRPHPIYHYGDILEVKGTINEHRVMFVRQVKIIGYEPNEILNTIYTIRKSFEENVQRALPEPYATLGLGMLVGTNKHLSDKTEQIFKDTGTIHMLVVSGFNITLVANYFLGLAGLIHRKVAILLAVVGTILFVLLTGAQPPAVRAGIMTLCVLSAQFFGKPIHALYTILMAALTMLIISPQLATSVSFQLSFAATLGIITLVPVLTSLLEKNKDPKKEENTKEKILSWMKSELSTTIAAQLAVLPILLYTFGTLSFISPLANLAVSWTVPYIMIATLGIGLIGYVSLFLSKVLALGAYIFTAYFLQVNQLLAHLPGSSLSNIKINWIIVAGYYMVLGSLTRLKQEQK